MRSAIRIAIIVGMAGHFGLVPETTYSLYQDSRSLLSNWHPSDEVPCLMWLYKKDLATGVEGCECVTVLDRLNITEIADAR